MKKKRNKQSNLIKKKFDKITTAIKNPGLTFANFLYFTIYHANREKIPLPILKFIIKYFGGWAGMGIYLPMREYSYNIKKKKILKPIPLITTSVLLISIIIYGIFQESDNFLFGFIQELLAGIILTLLIIYLLPDILNPPKKYSISIIRELSYFPLNQDKGKKEFLIVLKNVGEEVYRREEINWELYIPFYAINEDSFITEASSHEFYECIIGKFWKFSGTNSTPLFLDQKLVVTTISFSIDVLSGTPFSPFKIFYIVRTINGNYPPMENITKDFMGIGLPLEMYPKWGEIVFNEWYKPDHFKEKT